MFQKSWNLWERIVEIKRIVRNCRFNNQCENNLDKENLNLQSTYHLSTTEKLQLKRVKKMTITKLNKYKENFGRSVMLHT